ncbi:MAG TPA: Uma2 family endonuclease [Gemmataceae bacterium]|nr:Uma2 family endonuclease [Gemmataceae bacterium]
MSTEKPRSLLRLEYEKAAEEYLRSLPLEHFMEATSQATQRKITLESLDLVHARRPDVQVFNELLVQYPAGRQRKPRQVVPDNMIVVWKEPIKAKGSFDLPLQPTGPFCVMEYVSKYTQRKDYDDNFVCYERELKVPYYLLFYPDEEELTLYRHTGRRYVTVTPNEHGRYPISELELEVALLDGWVRYWYQGKLLPLPAELQRDLDEARRQADEAARRAEEAGRRADEAARRAEEAGRRADEATRRAEEEHQARLAAEQELAQLRAQLDQARRPRRNSS